MINPTAVTLQTNHFSKKAMRLKLGYNKTLSLFINIQPIVFFVFYQHEYYSVCHKHK